MKEIMWEAFALAILVGLLVNELSTIIEFIKTFFGEDKHTLITVILIIIFLVITLLLYVIKFTRDVIDKVLDKRKQS